MGSSYSFICSSQYTQTYIHTHLHMLLRADNIRCNLQTYCIERRSPVAFRVEGTPPWSLYLRFFSFSAAQSPLFPPNDRTILNVYTMHLSLNEYLQYVVLQQSLVYFICCFVGESKVLMMSFSDLLFLPQSSFKNASPSFFSC